MKTKKRSVQSLRDHFSATEQHGNRAKGPFPVGLEITARVVAEAGSPWFSGHFPGDPILPGIALLKMVADTIAASGEADLRMTGLRRVKFRKIVRPGEPLDLCAVPDKEKGRYGFRITSGTDEVCSGQMLLAPKDDNLLILP